MTSSKSNLNILFILFCIWWIYLSIFCSHKFIKKIIWLTLWRINWMLHITIELFSEIITIINVENSLEKVNIDTYI